MVNSNGRGEKVVKLRNAFQSFCFLVCQSVTTGSWTGLGNCLGQVGWALWQLGRGFVSWAGPSDFVQGALAVWHGRLTVG